MKLLFALKQQLWSPPDAENFLGDPWDRVLKTAWFGGLILYHKTSSNRHYQSCFYTRITLRSMSTLRRPMKILKVHTTGWPNKFLIAISKRCLKLVETPWIYILLWLWTPKLFLNFFYRSMDVCWFCNDFGTHGNALNDCEHCRHFFHHQTVLPQTWDGGLYSFLN